MGEKRLGVVSISGVVGFDASIGGHSMTAASGEQRTLDGQAIAWLVQLHAGAEAQTDADWADLEAWLSENPAHLD
ncbi:MAG TPA: FecR/PupR family sigma factor regulator, partial [Caulobacteraceae bacterium]